jgi:1,4-alpha-glucan branching enzyme
MLQVTLIHAEEKTDMAALEVVKSMKESLDKHRTIGTSREVECTFSAPKAKKVCIAGNFNDWKMTSMPMKKTPTGLGRSSLNFHRESTNISLSWMGRGLRICRAPRQC